MNLTYEDYNFLMEALDAKAKEIQSSGMMSGMLGIMLSKDKDEATKSLESVMDEAKEKDKLISEKVVLLKAKIITLRDKQMIAEIEPKGACK